MNVVVLVGTLARPPDARTLASGDVLVGFEVTVRPPEGRAETVPVVWPSPPAGALELSAGEEVVVTGRVRRRFFRAGGATASRTEVVASAIVPLRQARRARRLVDGVVADLGAGSLRRAATAPATTAPSATAPATMSAVEP